MWVNLRKHDQIGAACPRQKEAVEQSITPNEFPPLPQGEVTVYFSSIRRWFFKNQTIGQKNALFPAPAVAFLDITIHEPHQTIKILLVRLLANSNAFNSKYTLRFNTHYTN